MKAYPVRRAHADDAPDIANCVKLAYQHYTSILGKSPGPMLDDYAKVIQDHEVYVVGSGEDCFGVLVLKIDQTRILLDNVAVSTNAQGKGLGKRLVTFAESRAAELGYDDIELYTHELMEKNILMYQKWGYEVSRRVREKGYDRIYMKKSVVDK